MMNAMPSVASTCDSGRPARRRSTKRSTMPPASAIAAAAPIAASQKLTPMRSSVRPTYAPSMKYAPCDRFAIRINPKMSENPADSRNSSPPSARLFRL